MAERKEATVRFDVEAQLAPAIEAILSLLRRAIGLSVESAQNEFRRVDAGWRIAYGGRSIVVGDRAGLWFIYQLLSRPHHAIPAIYLSTAGLSPAEARLSRLDDPVLDATARSEYVDALTTIEEELARTFDEGETERRAQLVAERGVIRQQLRVSTRLAGRPRSFAHDAERARLNVTKAIDRAINEIGKASPELAGHLRRSIRKGSSCVYVPAEEIAWKV